MVRRRVERRSAVHVPSWPSLDDSERPRVLIEHPDPAAQLVLAEAFQDHGYDVRTCGGPVAQGRSSVTCPLVEHGSCPAVDGADLVVTSLQVNQGVEGEIVTRLIEDPTSPPVLLEATSWQMSQVQLRAPVAGRCYPFGSPSTVVAAAEAMLPAS